MTIEQKAQRYDEAIERAKKELQICGSPDCDAYEQIVKLFPELEDSWDEKMRKRLKDWLLDNINRTNFIASESILKEWISWVEKQKSPEDHQKEVDYAYRKGLAEGAKLKVIDTTDIKTWKYVVDAVLTAKDGIGQYLDSAETERIAKILQGRFGPIKQKPVEWSEEDERLRTSCIKHIEEELERIRNDKYGHSEIISDLKESCRERINWLKSIHLQKQWKPSEEQLTELHNVISGCSYETPVLIQLEKDLKRL